MAKWTIPFQVTRHQTGAALVPGTAPLVAGASGITPGQIVNDEIAGYSYIGTGNDGSGNSTAIKIFSDPTSLHYATYLIMN